jgi:Ca2+-binding RTX toxin-like protein
MTVVGSSRGNREPGTADGYGIYQQRYGTDGDPIGAETLVNVTTAGSQLAPWVTALEDGGWVVAWQSSGQDGDGYGIYQRKFTDSIGTPPTDIAGKLEWTEGKSGVAGALIVTDSDDTTGFTWSLLDDAGGRFAIDATTGKVTVAKPVLLDFEQATSHTITVKVTDNDGNRFTKVLNAKGTDVAMEDLHLTSGADKVFGGAKVDKFDAAKGDDTIRGGGGKGKDNSDYSDKTKSVDVTLNGSKAVTVEVGGKDEDSIKNFESVIGGSKTDTLTGDSASNTFHGGKGKNVLDGKGGKDFFVFDTRLGNKHVDTIESFKAKDDSIVLDHAIFTALATGSLSADAFLANKTGEAASAEDRIIYQKTTGKLFYDADGNGAGVHQLFARLTDHPKLTALAFLVV